MTHGYPHRRWLLGAVTVSLVVSLVCFAVAAAGSPFFAAQISDAEIYDTLGRRVLEGDLGHPDFAYHTQLYPLVVGAVYRLAGRPFAAGVYALQIVLGALTVACTFAIGRRLRDARVGLVAALAVALYAPLVSHQTKLLPTVLATSLATAALWACLRVQRRRDALLAGALLGLSGLARPELLPLAAVALALEWRARGRATALVLGAGVLLVLAPIALRNASIGAGPRVTSGQAAATFAAGNARDARGLYGVVAGFSGAIVDERRELLRLGRNGAGHAVGEAEAAAILWRRSLAELVAEPAPAARGGAWKLARLVSGQEPLQDLDLSLERETLWPIGWLPASFSVALALGALGLGLRRSSDASATPPLLLAFLGCIAVALVVFFVTSRHRAPAFPVVALLGAAGLLRVLEERRWVALGGALGAGLALHLVPPEEAEIRAGRRLVAWTNVALGWSRQGQPERARAALAAALQLRPGAYLPTVRLAELSPAPEAERLLRAAMATQPERAQAPLALASLLERDRPAEASALVAAVRVRHPTSVAAELAEARLSGSLEPLRALAAREPEDLAVQRALADALVAAAPAEARVLHATLARERPADGALCHRLGLLGERLGDRADAERWYRRALRQAAPAPGSAYNLALLLLERGDRDGARPYLRAARRAGHKIDARLEALAQD